ncbi:MAG: cyclic nucleotide-binding domain-containing protein [Alphaproteobacteria bacterium]|jgi:CRP-like cAMP-binding protein|nr:cyclic nucleotide-binding domain-containing protein [Alphaproteobacteria bacterium]
MSKTLKQGHESEFLDRYVFAPGETILREGSDGYCAYVIAAGSVEVVKKVGEGETVLGTLGKGAIFGEMALIDDAPHMATVRAVDWTVAITIRGDTFRKKIAEADPFIAKLLRILVGHARSATAQLVEDDIS